jgi:hypothetical protein
LAIVRKFNADRRKNSGAEGHGLSRTGVKYLTQVYLGNLLIEIIGHLEIIK